MGDTLAPVVLALAVILAAAKLGGDAAERIGQPVVLGELVVGVLVGNLPLLGIGWFQFITTNATIGVLAQLGAVILLFEVGLESTVRDMMQVGLRSLVVAVLGVVTPWALGWWLGALLLPETRLRWRRNAATSLSKGTRPRTRISAAQASAMPKVSSRLRTRALVSRTAR